MKLFEHEITRLSVQTSPEAMKQVCVIIMLAYFTGFQPKANRKYVLKLARIHILEKNSLRGAV